MGRIKIKDLPKDVEIGEEEMKRMRGGVSAPMFGACFQVGQAALCKSGCSDGLVGAFRHTLKN